MTLAFGLLCLLVAGCGSGEKVGQDAKDAHVYAYPLMTMELTRQNSTNVAAPEGSLRADGTQDLREPCRSRSRVAEIRRWCYRARNSPRIRSACESGTPHQRVGILIPCGRPAVIEDLSLCVRRERKTLD